MPRVDICMNCMTPKDAQDKCVHCGYVNGSATHTNHQLPEGTILKKRYMLGTLLGNGGFSNTYIGWDELLKTKVAVKEYLPSEFVARNRENSLVRPISISYNEIFEKGKKTFLDEARVLASFEDVPGIVNIRDFFKENNTAYLVMEYLEGVSLDEHISKLPRKRLPEKEAVRVLLPVIQTLKTVHRAGLIHRDISPDNIIITKEGVIKLIDFGACREYEKSNNKTKTIIVKQGYAPPEQYAKNGNQGEWTDIYALGATFYKLLTGKTPADSLDRMMGAENKPLSTFGISISKKNEEAINKAMSIEPSARFKNINMFEQAMETFGLDKKEIGLDADKQKKRVRIQALVPAMVLILLLMAFGLAAFAHFGNNGNTAEIPLQESQNPTEATPIPAPTPTPSLQQWFSSLVQESPESNPPAADENETAQAKELRFFGQLKKTGIDTTSQVVFIIENLTTGGKVTGGYDNLDMDPESTSYTVNRELAILEGQQLKVTVIFDENRSGNPDPGEAYAESDNIKFTGQKSFNIDFETWYNSRYEHTILHTTEKNPDGSIYLEITYPENSATTEYKRETDTEWHPYEGGFTVTENTVISTRSLDSAGNETTGEVEINVTPKYTIYHNTVENPEGTVSLFITYPENAVIRQYRLENLPDWRDYEGELIFVKDTYVYTRCMDEFGIETSGGTKINITPRYTIYHRREENPDGTMSLFVTYPDNAVIMQYRLEDSPDWMDYEDEIIFSKDAYVFTRCMDENGIETEGSVRITLPEVPENNLQDDEPVTEYIIFKSKPDPDSGTTMITLIYPDGSTERQYRLAGGEWTDFNGGGITIYEDVLFEAKAVGTQGQAITFGKQVEVCWPPTENTEGSLVPDPYLNAAIRKKLDKPEGEITKADLGLIIHLDIYNLKISSLEGLQYCTNLRTINANDNYISDISPLAGLPFLEYAIFINNPITDLAPLEGMDTLTLLNIEKCPNITDFGPLATLGNMKDLYMSQTRVSDLGFLEGMTGLRQLGINATGVNDLSPILNCKELVELSCTENAILDYTVLQSLEKLERLELDGNYDWDDFEFIY